MRRVTWWQMLGVLVVIGYVVWSVGSQEPDGKISDGAVPDGAVTIAQLPVEARETLALVDRGGPYPYERDGIVFMNREQLLPIHARGYWREFTVPTPGESSRGARRLVSGNGGEIYYTDDHYASFHRVDRGSG